MMFSMFCVARKSFIVVQLQSPTGDVFYRGDESTKRCRKVYPKKSQLQRTDRHVHESIKGCQFCEILFFLTFL